MTVEVPASREAEEAVIASVVIDSALLVDLHFLKPEHFYVLRNKWIWEAIRNLEEKRVSIDTVTITEQLETMGKLAEIGGPAYLTSIISTAPISYNAESYARIVEDKAIRRRVLNACNKAAQAVYNADDLEQVQEAATAVSDSVYRDSDNDNVFGAGLSAVYDRAGENYERTQAGKPLDVGLTTGFIDLDRILLGIENEESVLVAGRPGTGKTAFILNVASFAALMLHKKVAIFSQEMSAEEVARRMVAAYGEIDSQRIKTGALQDHEWTVFTNAIEHLQNTELYVSDASNLTPAKLRAKCLQLQKTQGLDVVFVDYIQLMSAGTKTENRTREVGYISQHIKMLARELKAPIISACQLSRKSEDRADKRPTLSDLRDSGDLEQDANTVIFLHRSQDETKQNVTEVIVAKRRDGQVGSAELIYKAPITKFVNATTKYFKVNNEH